MSYVLRMFVFVCRCVCSCRMCFLLPTYHTAANDAENGYTITYTKLLTNTTPLQYHIRPDVKGPPHSSAVL